MTFSPFDWPYGINQIVVTAGYTTQSTGVWVPESTASTAIDGHVSDLTVKELKYIDPGIVAIGVRKLAGEADVTFNAGDRIQIYEDVSTSAEWLVESKLNASGVMNRHAGINRNTYLLKRRT